MRQPLAWSSMGRRTFDASLAGALLLVWLVMASSHGFTVVQDVVGLAQVLPLFWRRRHPVEVFLVVASAMAAQVLVSDQPFPTQPALPIALYSVAAFTTSRLGYAAMGAGFVGVALATVDWVKAPARLTLANVVMFVVLLSVVVIAAWALGTLSRTRRAYVEQLVERGRRLEFEAAQQAQLAARDERARIARDMHDVVAHGLSVIVVQADGARYAAAKDPAVAVSALETIGDTGRASLTEMRRLLGLLRSDATGRDPQPGLADLDTLVAEARLAGARVETALDVEMPVPEGVAVTVYRIVQEALTNVRKHAGPHPSVQVVVQPREGALEVVVSDDGRGGAALTAQRPDGGAESPGLGLVGMRERVTVYGGTLSAGPRSGGGFAVTARIPL